MSDTTAAASVFINLPVADVGAASRFFESLGFSADPQFSAEGRAACIRLGGGVSAMLLGRETFAAFAPKPVANTQTMTAVMTALQMDSRETIDGIMEAALAAGATEPRAVQQNAGMYGRAFEDPDGHVWELLWIDRG